MGKPGVDPLGGWFASSNCRRRLWFRSRRNRPAVTWPSRGSNQAV